MPTFNMSWQMLYDPATVPVHTCNARSHDVCKKDATCTLPPPLVQVLQAEPQLQGSSTFLESNGGLWTAKFDCGLDHICGTCPGKAGPRQQSANASSKLMDFQGFSSLDCILVPVSTLPPAAMLPALCSSPWRFQRRARLLTS